MATDFDASASAILAYSFESGGIRTRVCRPTPGRDALPGVPPIAALGIPLRHEGHLPNFEDEPGAREGPAEPPQEGGRSEVKRSRAGSPHGEPRTESPSEAAQPKGESRRLT
jgi:hypothetical protein